MGGRYSQGYQLFQQLTIKAFLALRPHAEQIIGTVRLMLDTGLPSFKGEGTIKRLRERFVLQYNERQAAEWMLSVVRNAHENIRSTAYDEFQRVSLCLSSSATTLMLRNHSYKMVGPMYWKLVVNPFNELCYRNTVQIVHRCTHLFVVTRNFMFNESNESRSRPQARDDNHRTLTSRHYGRVVKATDSNQVVSVWVSQRRFKSCWCRFLHLIIFQPPTAVKLRRPLTQLLYSIYTMNSNIQSSSFNIQVSR